MFECFYTFKKRFQVWTNGSLVHIMKIFSIKIETSLLALQLNPGGVSEQSFFMRYCMSPVRSGFISAVKRNFIFGASDQGLLLLKQSPPMGKKTCSQPTLLVVGIYTVNAHCSKLDPVSHGFVLEKFYVTWQYFITRKQIMLCEHLWRKPIKVRYKSPGKKYKFNYSAIKFQGHFMIVTFSHVTEVSTFYISTCIVNR